VAVHDVEVEDIDPGLIGAGDFLTEPGEIGPKDRRCESGHAAMLHILAPESTPGLVKLRAGISSSSA